MGKLVYVPSGEAVRFWMVEGSWMGISVGFILNNTQSFL